jgi:hypothetical protein
MLFKIFFGSPPVSTEGGFSRPTGTRQDFRIRHFHGILNRLT